MEKMKIEWKDMEFEFIPYRDSVSVFKVLSIASKFKQLMRSLKSKMYTKMKIIET